MGVLKVQPRKIALGNQLKIGTPISFDIPLANTGDKVMEVTKVVSRKRKTVFFDEKNQGKIIIKPGEIHTIKTSVISTKKGRMLDYLMVHSNARNVTPKGYKVILIGTFE